VTHPAITQFHFVRHAKVLKKSGHIPPFDPPIVDEVCLDHLLSKLPSNADWHLSPLLRTRQTADLLMPALAPKSVQHDERLVEMNFGDWHDQPIAQVWESIAAAPRHNWSFIMPDTAPPNGGSFAEQCVRLSQWMDHQAAQPARGPQIIICHAGVMRAVMRHILNLDPAIAIGLEIPHLSQLRANLMEPSRATDAGGAWQFIDLG
jgi:alpha-ribazole phosphatase